MAISSKAISPKAFDLAARTAPRRFFDAEPAAIADGEGGSKIVGQASGCQQDGAGKRAIMTALAGQHRDRHSTLRAPKDSKRPRRIDPDQMLIRVWSNPLPRGSRFREPIPARH